MHEAEKLSLQPHATRQGSPLRPVPLHLIRLHPKQAEEIWKSKMQIPTFLPPRLLLNSFQIKIQKEPLPRTPTPTPSGSSFDWKGLWPEAEAERENS